MQCSGKVTILVCFYDIKLVLVILIILLIISLLTVNDSPATPEASRHNESTQFKIAPLTKYQMHRNTTHVSTNASLPRGSLSIQQIEISPKPWSLLAQFVVSGGVAGAALLGANLALDIHRRPKLSIDKMISPKVVKIDLPVYSIDEKLIPYHLRQFTIPYNVNRILIRNDKSFAAVLRHFKG